MATEPALAAMTATPMPAVRLLGDARLVEAVLGPVPLGVALAALPALPTLDAPVKLAAGGGDARLLADVPRGDPSAPAEEIATTALASAWAWLGDGAPTLGRSPGEDGDTERLAQALESLPWPCVRQTDGRLRVNAHAGHAARLEVSAGAGGARVSTTTAVAFGAPHALRALSRFALEANGRLRLARLSVAGAGAGVARLVWDAVAPGALPLETALPEAVQAVAWARAETARAARALGDPGVARAFLATREKP